MTILDATFVFTGGRAFYYSTNEGATFDWLFPQAIRLSFEGAPQLGSTFIPDGCAWSFIQRRALSARWTRCCQGCTAPAAPSRSSTPAVITAHCSHSPCVAASQIDSHGLPRARSMLERFAFSHECRRFGSGIRRAS